VELSELVVGLRKLNYYGKSSVGIRADFTAQILTQFEYDSVTTWWDTTITEFKKKKQNDNISTDTEPTEEFLQQDYD
jgi:hypothetical protein